MSNQKLPKIPEITSLAQLDEILAACKATPVGEVTDGQGFYKVKRQEFCFPDGSIQGREFIDKRPASMVVPEDHDGKFIMVVQPTGLAAEGALIEFPAGYANLDESSMATGIRELLEETGLTTELKHITDLGYHYQDPGSIRQPVHAYLAEYCVQQHNPKLDKGEYVQLYKVSKLMFLKMLHNGYLTDSNTFYAGVQALFQLGILEE